MHEAQSTEHWDTTRTFTGVTFPRYENKPDGPQSQSFVECTCGSFWKDHSFVQGWCPKKKEA